jgi:hypothetical protein
VITIAASTIRSSARKAAAAVRALAVANRTLFTNGRSPPPRGAPVPL